MPPPRAEYRYEWADETIIIQVERAGDGYAVTVDGETVQVTAASTRPSELDLQFETGHRLRAWTAAGGARRWVALDNGPNAGRVFELSVPLPATRQRSRASDGLGTLEAQMPGVVRRVLAQAGQTVTRGQTLLLLEAMKMEIRVTAPFAGEIVALAVVEGQAVERGQKLAELKPSPTAPSPESPA